LFEGAGGGFTGLQFEASPSKKFKRHRLNRCWAHSECLSFPITWGNTNKRIKVQAGLVIKQDPISKLKAKSTCLVSMRSCVQSPVLHTPEPKKKKKGMGFIKNIVITCLYLKTSFIIKNAGKS
jgi:hypothetical protein